MTSISANSDQPNKAEQRLVKSIILRMKIQRMIKIWKKMVKKSKQRINILKQWAITQQSYIKDLNLIIDKIQKPLLKAELITPQQDRILFPNLDAMLKLSQQLLGQVNKFLKQFNPHKTVIGNALLNFYKYFIIYRQYCNNFYKAQQIIKKAKSDPKSDSIKSQLPMDIQSYIIKPVQRPPKYQLLLRQYLKAIPPKHPDYEPLTKAISKYHDVNEENNQSMDLQIRNEKMIQLDKKYGGIINASRVYLFEELAKGINNTKLKLYVFNDLVLVVKLISEEKEEGYKKIYLDGQSFVHLQMDGKYIVNKLFICGTKQNLHCVFVNSGTRDKVYQRLSQIIHQLYRKQDNRTKVKKARVKMNVMKIQQIQVKTKPKLRIVVAGVQKRPKPSLNLVNFDTYYILKIQAPIPNNIFQYSYLKFQQLLQLQKTLKARNKMLAMPVLDDRPDDMNIYDVKKNMSKIIQCRELYVERFVNFVFRAEEFGEFAEIIADGIKINNDLWQFANINQHCDCQVCENLKKKESISLSQFEEQKQQIRSILGSPGLYNKFSRTSIDTFSRQSISTTKSQSICFFNNFTMPSKICQVPANQLNTLQRRLTWLQCKIGRIDYSLLQKPQQQKNIKVTISLLSLKQDQNINIKISKQCTTLQVLDQIAEMYQIQTMRDFGLFLDYQGYPRLIDRDQKLWEVLNQAEYQFCQYSTKQGDKSIWKKLTGLKKWGEEMIIGRKSKLYIKKYLFVTQELQIQACVQNPERYSLIIQQVFFRFKRQLLILNPTDTKKICAMFYVVNYMDKLAHLNQANFQKQKLKNILPQSRWHVFEQSQQFEVDVFNFIKFYENRMQNAPLPVTRREKGSTMFSKVQVIYNCIINLVNKAIGWSTAFFAVVNYDPPTLSGGCIDLLLGVNRKSLIIIRPKQLEPLVSIQLMKLQYKVSFKSIFIYTEEKVLRFDGQMMYDIKKLIQMYRQMIQKFGDS